MHLYSKITSRTTVQLKIFSAGENIIDMYWLIETITSIYVRKNNKK